MLLYIFYKPVLIGAQTEEIAFLLHLLHRASAVGAKPVLELSFSPKGFAGRAVPALVFAFIYISLVIELFKDFLDAFYMLLVGSADVFVVFDVHQLPEGFYIFNYAVHIFLGGDIGFGGLFGNFLAVLVRARQEKYVAAS